ncbi:sensor histidine kinase [Geothrix sp. 21YS21S-2]|uniref:sensor histidine kinase n=1 Tax=Geothrix sp. 21YS21S-2 TaxID=3068893 RepID=UPI0027B92E74|nr:histidine kinase [Geothrix sp. 21YS21S-2]
MDDRSPNSIRKAPLRWLLKAVPLGLLSGLPFALLQTPMTPRRTLVSCLVGLIFTLVMWSGLELGSAWVRRAGPSLVSVQLRWLLLFTALFGACGLLVRPVLGVNLFHNAGAALLSYLLGFSISSSIVTYHTARSLAEAERALERARGEANILILKAQLSPHTLFNALNAIAALIPGDPAGAEAAVETLSAFLRRMLEALGRDRWTLREEFDLIGLLLDLERARFGDRLAVRLDLPEAEADREIPPLLLLPLVENSLKHGFRPKVGPCVLSVSADATGVRVEDDGVGRAPGAPAGVGLAAVGSRLAAVGGVLEWPEARAGCVAWVRLCP